MKSRSDRLPDGPQAGAITILVVLALLVLFTVTAFGLSRNAIRQSILTGTLRQGTETRNVADSGIGWAVFWLDRGNLPGATAPGALAFQAQVVNLLGRPDLAGIYQSVPAGSFPDMFLQSAGGEVQSFDLSVMRSDKLHPGYTSANAIAPGSPAEALLPDLWSIRADASYVQGPVTFRHSREAMVSTPAGPTP